MRIIAGTLKGRRLRAPAWDGLRPTSDRLRGTLFDILAPEIRGAVVLDGYAGTGAVGIEALSRGAASVTFVERDRRAVSLIAENLRHCGVSGGCDIIRAEIGRMGRPRAARPFDVILLDPPYAGTDLPACVAQAAAWLTAGGVLVLEHARRRHPPPSAGGLVLTRTVPSGDSALSFYRHGPADASTDGQPRTAEP